MSGRYATLDPKVHLWEDASHDERGYCTSLCLPQHHGGRHAAPGRHGRHDAIGKLRNLREVNAHCPEHGHCLPHCPERDAHPAGRHAERAS